MSKMYAFYRRDLITILQRYARYIMNKYDGARIESRDVTKIKYEEFRKWTEDFLDNDVESLAVEVEDLLKHLYSADEDNSGRKFEEVVRENVRKKYQ